MYAPDGSETFWLNFTNIALGLVTLACLIAIAGGVAHELLQRWQRKAVLDDDHAFATPRLGVTMADGGKRIDEDEPAPKKAR